MKYQDGTEVTSADVKYAIERSNYAPAVLSNGPTYFNANLVDNTTPYAGSVQGPDRRPELDPDAGQVHDRLPPEGAVR